MCVEWLHDCVFAIREVRGLHESLCLYCADTIVIALVSSQAAITNLRKLVEVFGIEWAQERLFPRGKHVSWSTIRRCYALRN